MFSWQNPVYNRQVALMGADELQSSFANQTAEYNRALQDWQDSQGGVMVGDPTNPGMGPAFPGPTPGVVPGTVVGPPPPPAIMVGDPTDRAGRSGPPFPFDAPLNSVAPNNPPNGPTTIQDRPLPGVAGGFQGLPYQPRVEDLDRLMGKMNQYRENNQSAYADQMGGGYTGGVLPQDMQQRFADGGQFRANPTSGVRPNNPFAQDQASFGQPGQPTGASYGSSGGLGGLGGFGGSSPFNISNPYGAR